ncbi:MAG: matrixin family metalloprotease, partial [Moorea sp. SIO4A3]|nr:matrixin family metalloprotease [Moorena sp. SIO4A3]
MSDTFSSTHPLLSFDYWDTETITYSFYNDANSGPYYGPQTGVSEISEKAKDNIRSILETLERYLDVDFHEVADTATDYGLLRYMVSDGPGYAYAYLPNGFNSNFGNSWDVAGDVHLNQAYDTTGHNGFADDPGNHGYMTLIHEIGHSLGLKHPNPYEENDYGPFLPFHQDNTTNTVMSYNFAGKSAITPMIYDIQALQLIYGAREYNHGDTTYSFDNVYNYTDGNEDYGAT